MSILRLAHRWAGGLIGLLLALLGTTGTLLLHKDAFLRATLPHAADVQLQDNATLAAAVTKLFSDPDPPRSIILATDGMGLHRLYYASEASGAYADQAGQIVSRWSSIWERPEVWIFDLHHHLLIGKTGDLIAGFAALFGIGFVVTGLILWWPTRRQFAFSLLPRKLNRNAIVMHHRNLGVVAGPVIFLSMLTGSTMNLEPVSLLVTRPFSTAAEMKAGRAVPKDKGGPLAADFDWAAMIATVRTLYPDAELRIVTLPTKPGGLITVRMRQQTEWLPNGRTTFWFDPADGRLVASRDAETLPMGLRVSHMEFPIHAAKVGGLAFRLVMTVSGVGLALLGTFAVVTFWGNPSGRPVMRKRRAAAAVAR